MAEDTFKDRLILFARSQYDKGMNSFEAYCGINRGTIANIVKGVSTTTLAPIAEKCPELNLRWLITGEGNMLNNDEEQIRQKETIDSSMERIRCLESQIAELKTIVISQEKVISSLNDYINIKIKYNGESHD